ncbi:XRE family transcriptional regulator [Paenibacillus dendritiformis C454]|uniref:XRE family transcriptional regulator n=1 Tax=Paenibacillus dendritiformis C454 TaxID=1131935 RepID=H3SBE5_9BACL|nr:helix-turn-helix transcriptional regulator [Paenibacillus dendritiformis]EHQ63628.1 XRE family transcriptional regulator [Paenibacillus dendritiformis C454]
MSLGGRIRTLRLQKNLTQTDIAKRLGMGRSNFGHIENNRVTPSSDVIDKIADILGTTTDYLLGRDSHTFDNNLPHPANKTTCDIKKVLDGEVDLMYNGVPVSLEDQAKIKQLLNVLFWDRKE